MGVGVQRGVLIAWLPRYGHNSQGTGGCLRQGNGLKNIIVTGVRNPNRPALNYPGTPDIHIYIVKMKGKTILA